MSLRIKEDIDSKEISFDRDMYKLTDWRRAIPEGGAVKMDKKLKATEQQIIVSFCFSF